MKTKKSLFALVSGLLLAAVVATSPAMADSVKSGLSVDDGPYTIFNLDPDRTS